MPCRTTWIWPRSSSSSSSNAISSVPTIIVQQPAAVSSTYTGYTASFSGFSSDYGGGGMPVPDNSGSIRQEAALLSPVPSITLGSGSSSTGR
mmetsp:Transcript_19319/g.38232  ORF Transcript_19319/g.38232 Transcript_19319/m.38232 type:complete len:92 (-) Transcript_19319:150-425(-)